MTSYERILTCINDIAHPQRKNTEQMTTQEEPHSQAESHTNTASNSSTSLLGSTERQTTFFSLLLAENTSRLNFVSYLFATLFSICFFVFLNATQVHS